MDQAKWSTKRKWLQEYNRYKAGKLSLQMLSEETLLLMTELGSWQPGDYVAVEDDQGVTSVMQLPSSRGAVHDAEPKS